MAAPLPESNSPVTDIDPRTLPYILLAPEAAAIARLPLDRFYELCRQKKVPHRRIGRQIRVPRDPFLAWLAGQDDLLDGGPLADTRIASWGHGNSGRRSVATVPLHNPHLDNRRDSTAERR